MTTTNGNGKPKATLVTMDGKKGKTHAVDDAVASSAVTGEGLVTIASAKQLLALARAARAAHRSFMRAASRLITPERAAEVRKMRVEEGYSWRAVSQACFEAWNGDWNPSSNQIMGMAICEKAADFFGEDYMKEPWN